MNIKTLAFETNPVNPGNSVNSFDLNHSFKEGKKSSEGDFTKIIEERLRARAGNPQINIAKQTISEPKTYGSGISEKEIQQIINEFKNKA
jgi:hypothetical protein